MVININKCEIWSNWKRTPTLHIFTHAGLRIHWRLLRILKTSNKSASSNVFWYVKVCIFWKWKCIQYTINWDKTQMLKKFLLDKKKKKKGKKKSLFYFSRAPTCHSFTFNLRFSYELKHKVLISKTVRGNSHFRFCFVFIKSLYFCWTKCMDSLAVKRYDSSQN